MNSTTICGHCKRIEHCRMFLKAPHAVVSECGRYEETELHKIIRESLIYNAPTIIEANKEVKVVTRGNCMMCGKELTEGLFFCKECEDKASSRK